MIRVLCPHCRRRYRTVTEVMGRTVICHNCRMGFTIGELRPPFDWEPRDLAEDSWIGVEPPAERRELHHCIMCEAPLEENVIVCPSCGMNQFTGIQTRKRHNGNSEVKPSLWQRITMPYVLFALCLVVIAVGSYWLIVLLHRSAANAAQEQAIQRLVLQARDYLADVDDPYGLAERFGGRVDDQNLPLFVKRLAARDPAVQHAAAQLIGCGDVTDLAPLLTQAISPEMVPPVRDTLEAIGPRRLLELSVDTNEDVREAAAVALCLLFDFERLPETLAHLSEYTTFEHKHEVLNAMVRAWPEATGTFRVVTDEQHDLTKASVEQYGPIFYMSIEGSEFRTSLDDNRTFVIPIARWCAATGAAVDPDQICEWVSGHVTLSSPLGVGWQGVLTMTARKSGLPELPCAAPSPPDTAGQSTEVPLYLQKAR